MHLPPPYERALAWIEDGPARAAPRPPARRVEAVLRLTALAGLLLLPLVAAVYGTGLLFGSLRSAHFFMGFLLLPPLLLKFASTGYRFAAYYTRQRAFVQAGPPWVLPRLMAPALVAAAALASVSGVVLWAQGTERGPWSTVHSGTAVVLVFLFGLHVVVHGRRALRAAWADLAGDGALLRRVVVGTVVVAGLALAVTAAAHAPAFQVPQGDHREQASDR